MLDSLGNARSRRILALLVPFALVATLTSASWAAPSVMLYNRVNHELRTITSNPGDGGVTYAGQVNGRYATYWWFGRCGGEEVYRYDLKTKRTVSLPLPADDVWDPGVSADGTAYYVHRPEGGPAGGPYTYELVRQPIGAPVEVVTTLTTDTRSGPGETYVRDRPNGTRVVFFSWQDDAYKLVDRPPAAATRSR